MAIFAEIRGKVDGGNVVLSSRIAHRDELEAQGNSATI